MTLAKIYGVLILVTIVIACLFEENLRQAGILMVGVVFVFLGLRNLHRYFNYTPPVKQKNDSGTIIGL